MRHRLHPRRLLIFTLLGAADLGLTWKLIQGGHGRVYESNPVAGAWLEAYGWAGLAVFKTLAMLLVGLAAVYVSWHRPRTGRHLLTFGCLVTAGVVVYSCALLGTTGPPAADPEEDARRTEQLSRRLDHDLQRERTHHDLIQRLGGDLVAGRSTLAEAVRELAGSEKARDRRWLDRLHDRYPDRSDRECLALYLSFRVVADAQVAGTPWEALAGQLEAGFAVSFGEPLRLVFAGNAVREADQRPDP